jgi:hypothetical protein
LHLDKTFLFSCFYRVKKDFLALMAVFWAGKNINCKIPKLNDKKKD